jgi:hypothetical protein
LTVEAADGEVRSREYPFVGTVRAALEFARTTAVAGYFDDTASEVTVTVCARGTSGEERIGRIARWGMYATKAFGADGKEIT